VLLVGNGPSAQDLVRHLSPVAKTIYRSNGNAKCITFGLEHPCFPPIRYMSESTFEFSNGESIPTPDIVLLCTGYRYTFPFLRLDLPVTDPEGVYVQHMHELLFYVPDPTLVFLGLYIGSSPFNCFEYQSLHASRFLRGEVGLYCQKCMEKDDRNQKEYGRARHYIGWERQRNYSERVWKIIYGSSEKELIHKPDVLNTPVSGVSESLHGVYNDMDAWAHEREYWRYEYWRVGARRDADSQRRKVLEY